MKTIYQTNAVSKLFMNEEWFWLLTLIVIITDVRKETFYISLNHKWCKKLLFYIGYNYNQCKKSFSTLVILTTDVKSQNHPSLLNSFQTTLTCYILLRIHLVCKIVKDPHLGLDDWGILVLQRGVSWRQQLTHDLGKCI